MMKKLLVVAATTLTASVAFVRSAHAQGSLTLQGDITAVNAGDGLTGGADRGPATLNVVCGTGLVCNPDSITINTSTVPMGSGTLDRLVKWTPNGNTLGDSLLADDGSRVRIFTANIGSDIWPASGSWTTAPGWVIVGPNAAGTTAGALGFGYSTSLNASAITSVAPNASWLPLYMTGSSIVMRPTNNTSYDVTASSSGLDVNWNLTVDRDTTLGDSTARTTTINGLIRQVGAVGGSTNYTLVSGGAGVLGLMSWNTDNAAITFDTEWVTSAWYARDTSASVIYKQSDQLRVLGGAGIAPNVGNDAALISALTNPMSYWDLATGNFIHNRNAVFGDADTDTLTTQGQTTSHKAVGTTFATLDSGTKASLIVRDTTAFAAGVGGGILFEGYYTGAAFAGAAGIKAMKTNGTSGNYSFDLVFGARQNGSAIAEGCRLYGDTKILNCVGLHANGTPVLTTAAVAGTANRVVKYATSSTLGDTSFPIDDSAGTLTLGDSPSDKVNISSPTVATYALNVGGMISSNVASATQAGLYIRQNAVAGWNVYTTASSNLLRINSEALGDVATWDYTTGLLTQNYSQTVTGSLTVSGSQVVLNHGTSNWIIWNALGVAAPSFTTRSAGTKLVLYPSLGGASADYALGINGATMWFSVDQATVGHFYNWYAGTTSIMTLRGDGLLTTSTHNNAGLLTTTNLSVTTGAAIGDATTDAHTWLGTLNMNSTAGSNGQIMTVAGGLPQWSSLATAGIVAGSGTTNFIPLWTPNGNTLGNSSLSQNGTVTTSTNFFTITRNTAGVAAALSLTNNIANGVGNGTAVRFQLHGTGGSVLDAATITGAADSAGFASGATQDGALYFNTVLNGTGGDRLIIRSDGGMTFNGTTGTNGQVLAVVSGVPQWSSTSTVPQVWCLNTDAGVQNNWNPSGMSGCNVIRVAPASVLEITGLANGVDGRVITIHNSPTAAAYAIFYEEHASSTDLNRLASGTTNNAIIPQGASVTLMYRGSGSAGRWEIISSETHWRDSLFAQASITSASTWESITSTQQVNFYGSMAASVPTALTYSGTLANANIGVGMLQRLNGSNLYAGPSGFTGGRLGRVLTTVNTAYGGTSILHQSLSGSTDTNRISLPTHEYAHLAPGMAADYYYDTSVNRWFWLMQPGTGVVERGRIPVASYGTEMVDSIMTQKSASRSVYSVDTAAQAIVPTVREWHKFAAGIDTGAIATDTQIIQPPSYAVHYFQELASPVADKLNAYTARDFVASGASITYNQTDIASFWTRKSVRIGDSGGKFTTTVPANQSFMALFIVGLTSTPAATRTLFEHPNFRVEVDSTNHLHLIDNSDVATTATIPSGGGASIVVIKHDRTAFVTKLYLDGAEVISSTYGSTASGTTFSIGQNTNADPTAPLAVFYGAMWLDSSATKTDAAIDRMIDEMWGATGGGEINVDGSVSLTQLYTPTPGFSTCAGWGTQLSLHNGDYLLRSSEFSCGGGVIGSNPATYLSMEVSDQSTYTRVSAFGTVEFRAPEGLYTQSASSTAVRSFVQMTSRKITSSPYNPTPGTRAVRLRIVGGGGGSGGTGGAASSIAISGGGASGMYCEWWIVGSALLTGSTVTLGTAGSAGTSGGAVGGSGGSTSVIISGTTFSASGGGGSNHSGTGSTARQASGGDVASGSCSASSGTFAGLAALAVSGEPGAYGTRYSASFGVGGNGGSNPLGIGGRGTESGNTNGGAGVGCGAGGGGSLSTNLNIAGVAGTAGCVYVDEYY